MTRVATKGPLGLKPEKPAKAPRKGMRSKSKKAVAKSKTPEGISGSLHMECVSKMACIGCGTRINVKVHHCKCKPPHDMEWVYEILPYGRRSGPTDTIPLCEPHCHNFGPNSYHVNRPEFHRRNGFDYLHILPTRAAVAAMLGEIDY